MTSGKISVEAPFILSSSVNLRMGLFFPRLLYGLGGLVTLSNFPLHRSLEHVPTLWEPSHDGALENAFSLLFIFVILFLLFLSSSTLLISFLRGVSSREGKCFLFRYSLRREESHEQSLCLFLQPLW